MDTTTLAVRAMYEQFPYPAVSEPEIRLGTDVRLLLSHGQLQRAREGPLHCLDAGCGRAGGTLGAATTQPDVQFTAVDINRVALAEAATTARQLGLKNIRFQEVDLTSLDNLEVPEGGYDVIVSSGVLHHLASPDEGLRQLRRVLAPHGVISLMVYGTHGREPLYRMVRAIDLLVPRDRPIAERLAVARRLTREMPAEALRVGPIALDDSIPDSEFVDRYLNVKETSYDLATLWALLERHGLRFLRWVVPADWTLPVRTPAGGDLTAHLTDLERYQLVEQIGWRHKLELIVGTERNSARRLPPLDQWRSLLFAMNPEVTLEIEMRNVPGGQRVERLAYRPQARQPVTLTGLTASVLLLLKDQIAPFKGEDLIGQLSALQIDPTQALDVLADLVAREILFCPHPSEVSDR
jgi:SAM-dependent methyltransferase